MTFCCPHYNLLGEADMAWKQATSELAYERSGSERFLETNQVLFELVDFIGENPDLREAEGLGRLVAQLHTLRRMSISVAGMLHAGKEPVLEASRRQGSGHGLGTGAAVPCPRAVGLRGPRPRQSAAVRGNPGPHITIAPKLTIQGGTTEVLRGIVARGLGLR